jgi:hypothetical protein
MGYSNDLRVRVIQLIARRRDYAEEAEITTFHGKDRANHLRAAGESISIYRYCICVAAELERWVRDRFGATPTVSPDDQVRSFWMVPRW